METKKNTRPDTQYDVHVHSIRKRLGDVDGISAKAAIDGLVKSGLLTDDSAKHIRQIKFTQEKCKKGEEEGTAIMFEAINHDNTCD